MILTNNPKVLSLYPTARWIEGGPFEVLLECRSRVHEGYPLFTHPLMGDIHLIHNPFRTVILGEKEDEVDLRSLCLAEESIERVRLSYRNQLSINSLEDFQNIDLDLLLTSNLDESIRDA